MRRLSWAVPTVALLLLTPMACKRHGAKKAAGDGKPVSVLSVADPQAAVQLTGGFHGLEAGAWRWTAKNFVATLKSPKGGAQNGGKLELKLVVPEQILTALGPITLSAKVNGLALSPETYSQAGDATYVRDIPAAPLADDMIAVEFATDKALEPSAADIRELALIVKSVGLIAK